MAEDDVYERIQKALSALVLSPPPSRRSVLDEQLAPHHELIAQTIAKGHTYKTIAATLKEAGVKASPESLRRFVQRKSGTVKPKSRRASKSGS